MVPNTKGLKRTQRDEVRQCSGLVVVNKDPMQQNENGRSINDALKYFPAPTELANRQIVGGQCKRKKSQEGKPAGPDSQGKNLPRIARMLAMSTR